MLNRPMCCPNPVHDNESDYDAGMDIFPDVTNSGDYIPDQWYCNHCKGSFFFSMKTGISTMITSLRKKRNTKVV